MKDKVDILINQLNNTKRYRIRKKVKSRIDKIQMAGARQAFKNVYRGRYVYIVLERLGIDIKTVTGKQKTFTEIVNEISIKWLQ